MSTWRSFLEPDLGRASDDRVIVCVVCGKQKRVYSSAAVNASTCDSCLPENDDPELQRLLREDAFRRGIRKGEAA